MNADKRGEYKLLFLVREERRGDMFFCNGSIVLFVFLCGLRASARVKIYRFFIQPIPIVLTDNHRLGLS
jgi:hypothetical protein